MAGKKTLRDLLEEKDRADRELKIAKQNLKILESEEKRLRRNERTHRLCNHGGLLEIYLPPEEFTDEHIQLIMKIILDVDSIIRKEKVNIYLRHGMEVWALKRLL